MVIIDLGQGIFISGTRLEADVYKMRNERNALFDREAKKAKINKRRMVRDMRIKDTGGW